jgi:beta-glucanase (GH16 family)
MNIRLLIFFFLPFACQQSQTPNDEKSLQLVWSDEFENAGEPDPAKWDYDLGDGCPNACGWGNNELEYYTKDPKNVRIENGMLVIEAIKEEKGGKPYTSTRIVSRKKGDWIYGRLEIKANLPKGKGTWPAIWMLSTDWKYGGWPESGEIDIMEHVGYDPGIIHGTIHTEKYNHIKQTQKEGKINIPMHRTPFMCMPLTGRKTRSIFLLMMPYITQLPVMKKMTSRDGLSINVFILL